MPPASGQAPKKKFATLGDLRGSAGPSHAGHGHGHDDDDKDEDYEPSEDENQNLYAGGEKSGLAVENPDDLKKKIIERAKKYVTTRATTAPTLTSNPQERSQTRWRRSPDPLIPLHRHSTHPRRRRHPQRSHPRTPCITATTNGASRARPAFLGRWLLSGRRSPLPCRRPSKCCDTGSDKAGSGSYVDTECRKWAGGGC